MLGVPEARLVVGIAIFSVLGCVGPTYVLCQQVDLQLVKQAIDRASKNRSDNLAEYTVNEHYAVYRNGDEAHPVAEETVQATYRKETGKTYSPPVSQSGSEAIRKRVIGAILEREKEISRIPIREGVLINSGNYVIQVASGGKSVCGRDCLVLDVTPTRKSPYLLDGTLWVDPTDFSVLQIQGTTSQSPSFWTGRSQITRLYKNSSGFALATHARAVSNSFLFGQTIVKIDYS